MPCRKRSIVFIIVIFSVIGMVSGYYGLPFMFLEKLCSPLLVSTVLPFGETVSADDLNAEQMLLATTGLSVVEEVSSTQLTEAEQVYEANSNILLLESESTEEQDSETDTTAADTTEPLIAIYCTHGTESYGSTERTKSTLGGVYQVAQSLQQSLAELGYTSVLSDKLHDYPDWSSSYANSLQTIKQIQKQYPSVKVLIDVHRDSSVAGVSTVLATDQGNLAKIMLVVGSNKRLEHPHWQQNLAFAQQIGKELEKIQPGILREVRVQNGRYNQHLSTQAILVEIGSTDNTLEQAKASADILTEAIAEVLNSNKT